MVEAFLRGVDGAADVGGPYVGPTVANEVVIFAASTTAI
jgi:hypothetical protein